MASEPIECQAFVLRASIHCEGCKEKVKKVLQSVHGVLRCDIDARSNKVVVTASTKLDPSILVAKLRRSGKQAELWPEQSPEPKQSNDGETPKPATESKEASSNAGEEDTAATGQQQHNEAKGKQPEERDARVAVEYDRGGDSPVPRMAAPQPIMSYNTARPSPSASYYGRSSMPYEQQPYYHPPPQPSPYSYSPYQPASSEDYYYSAPPQRSAFSPPRDGYVDMFNDENANSCAVM